MPGHTSVLSSNLNIEMSADGLKSVWESLISILLNGNTEAAFSAELVTVVSRNRDGLRPKFHLLARNEQ